MAVSVLVSHRACILSCLQEGYLWYAADLVHRTVHTQSYEYRSYLCSATTASQMPLRIATRVDSQYRSHRSRVHVWLV